MSNAERFKDMSLAERVRNGIPTEGSDELFDEYERQFKEDPKRWGFMQTSQQTSFPPRDSTDAATDSTDKGIKKEKSILYTPPEKTFKEKRAHYQQNRPHNGWFRNGLTGEVLKAMRAKQKLAEEEAKEWRNKTVKPWFPGGDWYAANSLSHQSSKEKSSDSGFFDLDE